MRILFLGLYERDYTPNPFHYNWVAEQFSHMNCESLHLCLKSPRREMFLYRPYYEQGILYYFPPSIGSRLRSIRRGKLLRLESLHPKLTIIRYLFYYFLNMVFIPVVFSVFLRLTKKYNFIISYYPLTGALISKLTRTPYAIWDNFYREVWAWWASLGSAAKWLSSYEKVIVGRIKQPAIVLVHDEVLKEEHEKLFRTRVIFLPLGYPSEFVQAYYEESRNVELRDKLGLGDSPVIIYPDKLGLGDSPEALLEVIRLVSEQVPNAKFLFFGNISKSTMERLKSLGIAHAVKCTPVVPHAEMPYYYKLADIGLAISPDICVGSKITEMMALGKAFVTAGKWYRRYAGSSYLAHKHNCLLAPVAPKPIAGAIVEILKDFELRKRLSKNAGSIGKKFTWEYISRQFLREILYVVSQS